MCESIVTELTSWNSVSVIHTQNSKRQKPFVIHKVRGLTLAGWKKAVVGSVERRFIHQKAVNESAKTFRKTTKKGDITMHWNIQLVRLNEIDSFYYRKEFSPERTHMYIFCKTQKCITVNNCFFYFFFIYVLCYRQFDVLFIHSTPKMFLCRNKNGFILWFALLDRTYTSIGILMCIVRRYLQQLLSLCAGWRIISVWLKDNLCYLVLA